MGRPANDSWVGEEGTSELLAAQSGRRRCVEPGGLRVKLDMSVCAVSQPTVLGNIQLVAR